MFYFHSSKDMGLVESVLVISYGVERHGSNQHLENIIFHFYLSFISYTSKV